MKIDLKLGLPANVTVVSNEFIDQYMAAANGEYVKVFLYLLRHEREELDLASIADALNHTEADVKRALAYWKRTGVLAEDDREEADGREEFAPDPQIPERNRENFEPGARYRSGSGRSLRRIHGRRSGSRKTLSRRGGF